MDIRQINDLIIGSLEEDRICEILNEKWGANLMKLSPEHPLDFMSGDETYYVEIKSRRTKYKKYTTTMIGHNKIRYVRDHQLFCVFVFAFTDGDYYYMYNKNDNFEVKSGGRNDRGKQEYKKYYYIPIEKLIKI